MNEQEKNDQINSYESSLQRCLCCCQLFCIPDYYQRWRDGKKKKAKNRQIVAWRLCGGSSTMLCKNWPNVTTMNTKQPLWLNMSGRNTKIKKVLCWTRERNTKQFIYNTNLGTIAGCLAQRTPTADRWNSNCRSLYWLRESQPCVQANVITSSKYVALQVLHNHTQLLGWETWKSINSYGSPLWMKVVSFFLMHLVWSMEDFILTEMAAWESDTVYLHYFFF